MGYLAWLAALLIPCVCAVVNGGSALELKVGDKPLYKNLESGQEYEVTIPDPATDSPRPFSGFVFQVHSDEWNITLRNLTKGCSLKSECTTVGTHIGMVQQINTSISNTGNFAVSYTCSSSSNHCSPAQLVMMVAVGIPVLDPTPGGCSLTSALEVEAGLTTEKVNGSFVVSFQSSDIGHDPRYTAPPPCSDGLKLVQRFEYQIYQKCLHSPTTNSTFKAIESMLTFEAIFSNNLQFPFKTLPYNEPKRISYYTLEQALVLNVLARDTKTHHVSAYIPTVSYNCDYASGHCTNSVSIMTCVCGVLLGITGLYLCLLGHRFFSVEVLVFGLLIAVYLVYMMLFALTDWSDTYLLVGTAGFAMCLTGLLFTFLFFTNSYFLFLTLFGICMGYLITATILYTPLGAYKVVQVSYVYPLILLSGAISLIIPLLFCSSVLNIVASSVVGSYTILFSVGLFVHSSISDVVLRVVRNAADPSNFSANGYCEPTPIDMALFSVWILLCALSITVQAIIECARRRSFKKKQALARQYTCHDFDQPVRQRKYSAFPSVSLYKRLKRCVSMRKARSTMQYPTDFQGREGERRRLLSPSQSSP